MPPRNHEQMPPHLFAVGHLQFSLKLGEILQLIRQQRSMGEKRGVKIVKAFDIPQISGRKSLCVRNLVRQIGAEFSEKATAVGILILPFDNIFAQAPVKKQHGTVNMHRGFYLLSPVTSL